MRWLDRTRELDGAVTRRHRRSMAADPVERQFTNVLHGLERIDLETMVNGAAYITPQESMIRKRPCELIHGTGELAELTRKFDWSTTPVGAVDQWPDVLLSMVNMILSAPHPMFIWWGEELTQFYNDPYRASLGLDKHPMALGQAGRDCWPEIWNAIGPQIAAVMDEGKPSWHEDQLLPIFRDGILQDVYWTYGYSAIRDSSGAIRGTLVVCTDTTGRVLAEQEERKIVREMLRESEQQLQTITNALPALVGYVDSDLRYIRVNDTYETWFGKRKEDFIGHRVSEMLGDASADVERHLQNALTGEQQEFEATFQTNQGDRCVSVRHIPLKEESGTTRSIVVQAFDVTGIRRAEIALRQSEKLAAVGRLAASIAHEINNPLESVTNLLYLMQSSEDLAEVHQYVETAERELRRVSLIANQTLRFHRQSTNAGPAFCYDLIGDSLSMFQGRLVNNHIEVQKRKRAGQPVRCFGGEIRQVLSNLIGNAIDSMPAGGRLLMRSREATNWVTGAKGLVITVADTGTGMSREVVEKIFNAFYTTKGIGGTGLGLWISREIVDRHRGELHVRSSHASGRSGTVFTLFLPFEAVSRL